MSETAPTPALQRWAHHQTGPLAGRRGDRGSSLILALAFLIIFTTLVVGLSSLAFTSSASGRTFRRERVLRTNADAALQAAVMRAKLDTTIGHTAPASACDATYDVQEVLTAPSGSTILRTVAAGSTLTVSCTATPGTTPDATEAIGGQAGRDITFKVVCKYDTPATNRTPILCGSGANTMELGTARVRFSVNYDPTVPAAQRANVPKVLSWTLKG